MMSEVAGKCQFGAPIVFLAPFTWHRRFRTGRKCLRGGRVPQPRVGIDCVIAGRPAVRNQVEVRARYR